MQNPFDFTGKVVMVTGVARPGQIGHGVAKAFGAAGAKLVLADVNAVAVADRAKEFAALGFTAEPAAGDLPPIPDLAQPIQMQLGAVKKYFDAGAAVFIDARPKEEYDAGHIPGALNLPYDQAVTDPARLESFDAGGKPIVVYCGGGTCELSMNLAWAMIQSGQKKLLVFMGGIPEWEGAGYPLEKAAGSN